MTKTMKHYEVTYNREYDGQLVLRHKYTYAHNKEEAIENIRKYVAENFNNAQIIEPHAYTI